MWVGDDPLAASARMAGSRSLGEAASVALGSATAGRANRLVPGGGGQFLGAGGFGGAQTGPSATDRARKGSKHHLISDAQGIPLAVRLTGANVHDSTQLQCLVEAIPPVRGKPGRPRRRPEIVQGDRAYDSQQHRAWLRQRGIRPLLAKRRQPHGSGLGKTRWVVERTLAWLHHFRRLRIRWERRHDIHLAFLNIGCCLIAFSFLQKEFC